jgi:hypothetical protein
MKIILHKFVIFIYSYRSEWDQFISDSVRAESIPIRWVEPNPTPNEEWSKFLSKNSS